MDETVKYNLGYLIQYYRLKAKKSSSLSKYNKQEFIKDFNSKELICSEKTLYNIEHRLPVRNDDVYELLLRNLGFTYKNISNYNAHIEKLESYLYQGILTKKKTYLLKVDKYLKANKDMKNYIIYNEFYQCCEFILNYELYHKYNLDYEHYLSISSIFSKSIIFLIAYTIHQINCETTVDMKIFQKCELVIRENHLNDSLYQYHMAFLSLYVGDVKKSLDIFTQLYNSVEEQKYNELRLSLSIMIARIESVLDLQYTITHRIKDVLVKLKQSDLPNNQLLQSYITLGNLYYEYEDYHTSIECFDLAEDIEPTCFSLFAPYYYHGKEKLGEAIRLRDIFVSKEYYPHYYPFAYYYELKYKEYSKDYILTYLVETILPHLKKAKLGTQLDHIFLNEIIEVSIKTRKYQMAVEYLSNFYG